MGKNSLLSREIQKLKEQVLRLGGIVERSISNAVRAVEERDVKLAEAIIRGDREIDILEVELEEDCLKILALHQPVAVDLRFVITVLKVNNDLERIGDFACNMAKDVLKMTGQPATPLPFDFPKMATLALAMLTQSLDALVTQSTAPAWGVMRSDDEVDAIHQAAYEAVIARLPNEPNNGEALLGCLGISRALERVADLSSNIAEDVIYLVEGTIVRH